MTRPSAAILAAAATTVETIDAEGRRLSVRRLHALDKLRLFKAVGAELAQNPPYLGMAMLAATVSAIDGIPVPIAVNEMQIEALVSRLGDSGLAAVAGVMEPPLSDDALRDDAGNSAGTPI